MGPDDFIGLLEGHNRREQRRLAERDNELYLQRLLTTTMYNANVKPAHRKRPQELFPIPSIDQPRSRDKIRAQRAGLYARAKKRGSL